MENHGKAAPKRTPTSLNIEQQLWQDAKIEAIKRGVTVTELFESALRNELKKPQFGSNSRLKGGRL
jgi:hypothetical protein